MNYTESIRYDYTLTEDSVVWDCGGHAGDFAEIIHARYKCKVHVFEPIPEFYEKCHARLHQFAKVHVHPFGISNRFHTDRFGIGGDMSGQFQKGGSFCEVALFDPETLLELFGYEVDLIKLNIEGGEMDVLEAILDQDLAGCFKNIQVQPHRVAPDSEDRWEKIQSRLLETHTLQWEFPWVWSNYAIK